MSLILSLLIEANLGLGVFKKVLLDKETPEDFTKFLTQTSLPTIRSGERLSLINDTLSDTPDQETLTRDRLEVIQIDFRDTTYMYLSNDTYLPHTAPDRLQLPCGLLGGQSESDFVRRCDEVPSPLRHTYRFFIHVET